MKLTLPTDSTARKNIPIWAGLFRYFPAGLAAVAQISLKGDRKHNPENTGLPYHSRGKSNDHDDCILRHTMDIADTVTAIDRNEYDDTEEKAQLVDQALEESAYRAWRALAAHQELAERFGRAPIAPAAKLPPVLMEEVEPGVLAPVGAYKGFGAEILERATADTRRVYSESFDPLKRGDDTQ